MSVDRRIVTPAGMQPSAFYGSYSIQFYQRRFEVCGHEWQAIKEHNRGIAILNNCKYGHSAYRLPVVVRI